MANGSLRAYPESVRVPNAFEAQRCAICGGENDCGAVAGRGACWCAAATITRETLARVPADLARRVCICERCARTSGANTKWGTGLIPPKPKRGR
jgi:hypothetical protein